MIELPSTEAHSEAVLAGHQLTVAVRAAVARLPPRYRRPLVLYHLDGLRQDRIAVSRTILHICNGHATSSPLEQAGVPGTFKLFVDVLLEGPCPLLWGEAWQELRMKFLIAAGYASAPEESREGAAEASGPEVPQDPEIIWDDAFERALSSTEKLDEIVLWYEHDLFDQLLLIRLLALIARHVGARPCLSLVCIGEHPEVPAFQGLGQLGPDQLASLFETRVSIDEASIALGRDAWAAYTDPEPKKLEALLERDLSALPFLARALRRHLEEYPGIDDGLSRTERNLLILVQDGVVDATRAWWQLRLAEDCHYLADSWFLRLVRRLTESPAPLLTLDGELLVPPTLGQGTLSLTPLGEKVVRGHVDWLSLSGIDRWLGGVHLTDAKTAWRWDPTARRLTRQVRL